MIAASRAYPKPANFKPDYGTAGFRAEASLLASTVFRCGPPNPNAHAQPCAALLRI